MVSEGMAILRRLHLNRKLRKLKKQAMDRQDNLLHDEVKLLP